MKGAIQRKTSSKKTDKFFLSNINIIWSSRSFSDGTCTEEPRQYTDLLHPAAVMAK